MVKVDDVVFWILLLSAAGVLLWLLKGSPTLESTIIMVGLFIISSEIMLWRKYFEVDKNTAVGFEKVKNDLDKRFNEVNGKLDKIESLIKRK